MGKKVYVECELEWTKLREEDRDMGSNLMEGSDQRNNIEAKQGLYVVNCVIDDAAKNKMVADGIPNKGLQAQLFLSLIHI